jgi:pimeloyl-ACP methyl ester carboxylesterase
LFVHRFSPARFTSFPLQTPRWQPPPANALSHYSGASSFSPAPAVQQTRHSNPFKPTSFFAGLRRIGAKFGEAFVEADRNQQLRKLRERRKFEPSDVVVRDNNGFPMARVRFYTWNRARAEAALGPYASQAQREAAGVARRSAGTSQRDPLLLVHGLFHDATAHRNMLDQLCEDHDEIVLMDTIAHGDSILAPWVTLTPALIGEITEKAVRQHFGDRKFGIYGNSLGGAITLQLSNRLGPQVSSSIVASPVGARAPEETQAQFFGALRPRSFRSLFADRNKLFDYTKDWKWWNPRHWGDLAVHFVGSMVAEKRMATGPLHDMLARAGNADAIPPEALHRIAPKTTYVHGLRDQLIPGEYRSYFKQHLGGWGSPVIEPPNFVHSPGVPKDEQPQQVATAIRQHEDLMRARREVWSEVRMRRRD